MVAKLHLQSQGVLRALAAPIILQPMVAARHEGFAKRLSDALTDQGHPEESDRNAYLRHIGEVGREGARKWLSGEDLPRMHRAVLLALALGVCVDWLLTGRLPKKPPSKNTLKLIDKVEKLEIESQVTLKQVADSLEKAEKYLAEHIEWDPDRNPDRRKKNDECPTVGFETLRG